MPLHGRALHWAITAVAGSGFLLFGYGSSSPSPKTKPHPPLTPLPPTDQGVMSGLLTGRAFTTQFPSIDTTARGSGSSSLQGTVVAIYEIGCFFGSLFCLFFGERLGRKKCIWLGCVVLSVGAALQASAFGIPQMVVGRVVAGLGNGVNTSTIREWILFFEDVFWGAFGEADFGILSGLAFGVDESGEEREGLVHRVGD